MLSKHHEDKYLSAQGFKIDKRHIKDAYVKKFGTSSPSESHANVLQTLTDLKAELLAYCAIRRLGKMTKTDDDVEDHFTVAELGNASNRNRANDLLRSLNVIVGSSSSYAPLVLAIYRRLADDVQTLKSEGDNILETTADLKCTKNAHEFILSLELLRTFIVRANIMEGYYLIN